MYNQYPPQGQYPGQYPPPQGQYPPQGYPPQNNSPYPPQGGQYPPQGNNSYYPPGGQYPPPSSPYPSQGGQYPPQSYPPQGGQYPPYGGQYPPQNNSYGGYGGGGYGSYNAPVELPASMPPTSQASSPYPPQGQSQSYEAPPPPYSGYGGAPPQSQYGAPPQKFSAPQFAPPPGGGGGPPTAPSPGYGPPQIIQWDANPDAQALRNAMKGFGTDEKTLIRTLANKDPYQIEAIKSAYNRLYRRNLEEDIKSETSKYFKTALTAIVRGPLLHDVHLLHSAMDGPGTKEKVLNDVLLGRSNADIQAIKSMYRHVFHTALETDVKGDLSMKTERHFMIVLGACRAEDSAPVNQQAVDQDVMEIYRATEGKMGTDEMLVCSILSTRNDNQIRAISYTYAQKFRRPLEDVLKKEFSGHMKDALLFQLNNAVDKYMHAATLLGDAMAGMGTKDELLVARVVRYHWDRQTMENIKGAFRQRYKKTLANAIRGETSGDYEKLLVTCVGE